MFPYPGHGEARQGLGSFTATKAFLSHDERGMKKMSRVKKDAKIVGYELSTLKDGESVGYDCHVSCKPNSEECVIEAFLTSGEISRDSEYNRLCDFCGEKIE